MVWNGSNALLSVGKAVSRMIYLVPSIHDENGSGFTATHAGNQAQGAFSIRSSFCPGLQKRCLEKELLESSLIKHCACTSESHRNFVVGFAGFS